MKSKYKQLLAKDERRKHPVNGLTLYFIWTISRGRDTYGYNIVTCREGFRREKVASTCGGGYDMKGTVLAGFIERHFPEELKRLNSDDFYGLSFWNPKTRKHHKTYRDGDTVHLDGGCGWSSMERILNKIGFYLRFISESRSEIAYIVEAI